MEKVFLPNNSQSGPLDYGKKVLRGVEHVRKEEQGRVEGSGWRLHRRRDCFLVQ